MTSETEFVRGYKDGYDRNPCRPTSPDYHLGYKRGKEIRDMLDPIVTIPARPDFDDHLR